jgi:predicted dinucleotide-binding enzyme
MTHSSHASAEPQSGWLRWTLAALVAGTLLFGFWGNWRYERIHNPEHAPDLLSVFYHACQFLILHGVHLHDPVPWQLHAGRILGAVALFTAGFVAFAKFFQTEMLMWRLRVPWRRSHVLICGLGELGLRLALDARERRKVVVAIEKHGDTAVIERAQRSGILVLEGDACDAATLHKARIERADFLVAACPDDATNVAIAATAARVLPEPLKPTKRDQELRRLLADQAVFGRRPGFRVHFRDLDLHETAARQALRQHPLDFQPIRETDETTVHLVVVGFGSMGECLALHAARIGHFANSVTTGRRMRITVIGRSAALRAAQLRQRCAKIDHVCELAAQDADPTAAACLTTLDELSRQCKDRHELLTYAVCLETGPAADDRENLRIGMELGRIARDRAVQTLIYQSTRGGFAALFPPGSGGPGKNDRVHAFGMVEDIYSWDVLLHESEDQVARALHKDYVKHRVEAGDPATMHPGWDDLQEHFQESNRHAADHIPIKLRALGYHDAPLQPQRTRIQQFTDEQVLLLARMEHQRWCAERWFDGWEYGPETIRSQKISKDLIEWEKLSPEEQKKDFEQIRAIPEVLFRVGRGIYR